MAIGGFFFSVFRLPEVPKPRNKQPKKKNTLMNTIPTVQPLNIQEVHDYKVSLLLNINSLLLNLISINETNSSINNVFLTKLHGNIKYLVMMSKTQVDTKTLDLSHIPQINANDNKINQTISTLNKYYLLFNKLIELYP